MPIMTKQKNSTFQHKVEVLPEATALGIAGKVLHHCGLEQQTVKKSETL